MKKSLLSCVSYKVPKMKYIILIFVIVQVLSACAQDDPAILKISRNQERNIGDSTELKCKVANSDDYPVVWLKDRGSKKSAQYLSMGSQLITQDDRFTLKYDKATSSYNLKIDDIRQSDVGLYKCEIQLSDTDKVSAEVFLKLSSDGSAFS